MHCTVTLKYLWLAIDTTVSMTVWYFIPLYNPISREFIIDVRFSSRVDVYWICCLNMDIGELLAFKVSIFIETQNNL